MGLGTDAGASRSCHRTFLGSSHEPAAGPGDRRWRPGPRALPALPPSSVCTRPPSVRRGRWLPAAAGQHSSPMASSRSETLPPQAGPARRAIQASPGPGPAHGAVRASLGSGPARGAVRASLGPTSSSPRTRPPVTKAQTRCGGWGRVLSPAAPWGRVGATAESGSARGGDAEGVLGAPRAL